MNVPSNTCPNCGESLDAEWRVCPHCGRGLTPDAPPPPVLSGEAAPGTSGGRLLTSRAWFDVVLGLLIVAGSILLYGIGLLIPLVLYFVLKSTYPSLSRGLGYGLLGITVILLGLIAVCFASLANLR
jgi:hypothetical protein